MGHQAEESPTARSAAFNFFRYPWKTCKPGTGKNLRTSLTSCLTDCDGCPVLQLIGVVMDMTEVLKTSFSDRSLQARSLGETDYTADAGVTAITMLEVRFPSCDLSGTV